MSIYLFQTGEIIERKFSILAPLGKGSFSQVYKAEDLVMGEICVLKVLQPADDAVDSLKKLREEANIYRKLGRHKHIARLLDTNKFAERDDLLYLKLEYIEGETLEHLLKHGQQKPPIPISQIRRVIIELLDALEYMHTRSEPILHRDIKPSNLILSPSRGLVVIDFNVSKELISDEKAQTLVGTLPYIPPEIIARGIDWDMTGDLYAVGVLLYRMLTSENPPFETRTGSSFGIAPVEIQERLPDIPSGVISILNKAIAYNRQERFQTAQEMKATIEQQWPLKDYQFVVNPKPIQKEVENMSTEMMPPLQTDAQQLDVRRLLREAKDQNAVGDFTEADRLLSEAEQLITNDKILRAEYKNTSTVINNQRAQRASQLAKEIAILLDSKNLDDQKISTALVTLQLVDAERAQRLQSRYADELQRRRDEEVYLEVKAECEALWRRAEDLIAANTPYETVLSQTYDKAVQIVEQAESTKSIAEIEGLLRDARYKQEQARQQFEVLSTAAEVGSYQEMLAVLDREKDDRKKIQLIGPGNVPLGTMTVREAREQVTKMAAEFAYRKAQGYYQAAQIHMDAHAPGAAKRELAKSDQLFMLDEEAKRMIQNYREKTVAPELARFQEAQQLLEQARKAIKPLESWRLADKAHELYQWLPDIDDVRMTLLSRLKVEVEKSVTHLKEVLSPAQADQPVTYTTANVEQTIEQSQEVVSLSELLVSYVRQVVANIDQLQQKAVDAQQIAQQSRAEALTAGRTDVMAPEAHAQAEAHENLAKQHAEIAENAVKRLEAVHEMLPDLEKLQQEAEQLQRQAKVQGQLVETLTTAAQELSQLLQTNPAAANTRWQALASQYGQETLESFSPLERLARDLDAQLNIKGLIARLEQDFAANDPERIRKAIIDCEAAAQKKENLDYAPDLTNLRVRLGSRLAYLNGQLHMQAGDADAALAELKKVTAEPDVTKAQQLTTEIEQKLQQDKQVKQALTKAEKLLKSSNPKQAYETLKPYEETLSRYHETVIQTLSEVQEQWEAATLKKLQDGLSQPLTTDIVNELRHLERELRTELGVSGHPLSNRVLAACFAYEAEQAKQFTEWSTAVNRWEQALQLDRNIAYLTGLRNSKKQQAESLALETPSAAIPLILELQKEFPDDPDLHHWAARIYVQQAQKVDVSASEAESHYRQAMTELNIGLEQMVSRSGTESVQLKAQMTDLQQMAQTGLVVEQQKQAVERRLSSTRTVSEFHKARQDADELLQKHPQYPRPGMPTLPDWWNKLRQQTITSLEKEANNIPVDQVWRRFDPLGKILALDEGHGQAVGMLTKIDSLIRDLEKEINALKQDNVGLTVQAGSELEVLSEQLGLIRQVQERSDVVYTTLIHFADQPILSKKSSGFLNTLNKLAADLLHTQEKFDQFNVLKSQALSALGTAQATGNWDTFDKLINEIGNEGFSTHRATIALKQIQDQYKQRRTELQQLAKELREKAEQGNFIAALRLADRMQESDPEDSFGIQRHIVYHDPQTDREYKNLGMIGPLLDKKSEQLKTIHKWLLHCGLKELGNAYELTAGFDSTVASPEIIDWSRQKEQVVKKKKKGDFLPAIELCEKADLGNPIPNTLSLTEALSRLNQPPIRVSQAESKLAETLLLEAEKRANALQANRQDVVKTIEWLKQQAQNWEDAWHAYTVAHARLRRANQHWNPLGKKERVQAAQSVRDNALFACVQISPDHPDLIGSERSSQ